MSKAEDYINNISLKLQDLLKKFSSLKKENIALSAAVKELKENEINFQEKISFLETQNSILKASAGNMSPVEKNDFEKKMKVFIKDIDACITMLNN